LSIRARLLSLILLATLIPALMGGALFLEYRESEIANAREDLAAVTRQIAQDLTDTVRSTAQLHYGLSRARDFDTQDRNACSVFLAGVLKEHPQYTGILTIRPDGQLFCDSLHTGRNLVLTDRKYFNDALGASGPLAVEPVFGRLTGIAVLQVAYGVRKESGEPQFVLLASLNLEKYMQSRSQALPRGNAVVALMDSKGTVLTWHPGGDKLRGTSMADTALFRLARERQGENVREDIEVDGVSRIWVASTLPGFAEAGVHVLVGVSTADLLAEANRKLRQALATLAVVWLLVFAGAWVLVEWGVRRQAERIIAAVRQFSGGDFSARIGKPYPRGEIGELMVALDHAFELMQAQRNEIQTLNANLERRVAERTVQLEASVKELEDFTYTVSHDLRAPLRAIGGFSRILTEDHGGRLDDEGRRLLGVIDNNSRKMGALIDDLLDFSRLGRKALSTAPIDMKRLVEEVLGGLEVPGERRPGVVLGEIPPARGDATLVKQVWANLLGNAIKFSGKREQPVIEVSGREDGAETVYCVKDNGAGFDMQYYDQLFGVFRRLHGAHEFTGTGVGLAIVQRVVTRHGGRVWAEGKVGEGAAFYFSLPTGKQDG
jgi:signal transduction histidine kinase